mmetsp:Transcript_45929/g.112050  ORF Transcript_45929/g.112050 Transcript_45929/m.112050 type:complete len:377 (+) Transcript_45929:51-1181(+)
MVRKDGGETHKKSDTKGPTFFFPVVVGVNAVFLLILMRSSPSSLVCFQNRTVEKKKHHNSSKQETSSSSSSSSPSDIWEEEMLEKKALASSFSRKEDGTVQNLRLVIVGDSVTRYQYLNLVNYIENGTWDTRATLDNGTTSRTYIKETNFPGTWPELFDFTNKMFHGNEICDCYRNPDNGAYLPTVREARYYADSVKNNNYVSYFPRYGDMGTRGNLLPHQLLQQQQVVENSTFYLNTEIPTFQWDYNWTSLIFQYVARMEPKPQYFVFNSGLWQNHDLDEPTILAIREALVENEIVGIYKTTTRAKNERGNKNLQPYEQVACEVFPCLNLHWTADLPHRDYLDRVHFSGPAYRRMNQQLLDFINVLSVNNLKGEQ